MSAFDPAVQEPATGRPRRAKRAAAAEPPSKKPKTEEENHEDVVIVEERRGEASTVGPTIAALGLVSKRFGQSTIFFASIIEI